MNRLIKYFLCLSLVALLLGIFFGCISAFQFLYPDFFKALPFFKTRPIHVSSVVGWIFLSSAGSIYYFLYKENSGGLFSKSLTTLHLALFTAGGLAILTSYALGFFGGREYWEFNPAFSLLVATTWLFFVFNFFGFVRKRKGRWPVYLWMWGTGIVFFLLTFAEANLWVFPHFGNHPIRDLTVQWKAYGALVGSWNMLVYGIAIYLAEKIKGDNTISRSNLAFAMFFLGFFNLLFGWAHHIYLVPCPKYIRVISYAVSMTELIILFKIIYNARPVLREGGLRSNNLVYNFLFSSDVWIFLNLFLALLISVPAINAYTHGTHVTVAHAMGSTIGINTFILLGSVCYITIDRLNNDYARATKLRWGVRGLNISLALFWLCLIGAGVKKGLYTRDAITPYSEITNAISPYLLGFAIAGLGILVSVLLIAVPLINSLLKQVKHE